MRKAILLAIFCAALFYAPVPITAQHGGGPTPLIPVVDMPQAGGGATAPSEPPLEVDPDEVPELVSPEQAVGDGEANGGAPAPAPTATPEPETAPEPVPAPEPEPAPAPTAEPALAPEAAPPAVEPAQAPDDPTGEVPGEGPTDTPDTPNGEDEDEQDEEEFEEEFDDIPEAGDPDADVPPQASAPTGPQLPRTGADLPALFVSGLSLMVAGMALRGLVAGRA